MYKNHLWSYRHPIRCHECGENFRTSLLQPHFPLIEVSSFIKTTAFSFKTLSRLSCILSLLHKHFVSIVFILSASEPITWPNLHHMIKWQRLQSWTKDLSCMPWITYDLHRKGRVCLLVHWLYILVLIITTVLILFWKCDYSCCSASLDVHDVSNRKR